MTGEKPITKIRRLILELKYWYLRQIIEDNSEPQAPIIDNGVLLKNTILTVFGAPKARKSFFAMNCGIAIACGEDFCGLPLDEDSESDLTDSRLETWASQLKGEIPSLA